MAERLNSFPEDMPLPRMARRYPWDEWLDGSTWELRQGIDFPGRVDGFRGNLAKKAKDRHGYLKSARSADGKRLVIQFIAD